MILLPAADSLSLSLHKASVCYHYVLLVRFVVANDVVYFICSLRQVRFALRIKSILRLLTIYFRGDQPHGTALSIGSMRTSTTRLFSKMRLSACPLWFLKTTFCDEKPDRESCPAWFHSCLVHGILRTWNSLSEQP